MVKVQHPEVGALVNTDLTLLRKAVVLFKYVPQDIAVVDLNKVIDELSASLLSEVNTLDEARNGEEFYKLNNGDGPIRVPKVYLKYCAPKVLVNEAIEPWKNKSIMDAIALEKERRESADCSIVGYTNCTFIPQYIADMTPAATSQQKLTRNPLDCGC